MYCEEKDRSWCSSSKENDNRAITIEVASDTTHPYAVNEKAYSALINLLVDICRRNGIPELRWKGDKSLIGKVDQQNMTVHRWFAATECPGEYLYARQGQIAAEVNARLNGTGVSNIPEKQAVLYRVRRTWEDAGSQMGAFRNLEGAKSLAEDNPGYSVYDETGKAVYCPTAVFKPYQVRVDIPDLNIRRGPGTNYITTGRYTGKGVFAIVEEADGPGASRWGKLLSGAGWIALDFCKRL